MESAKNFMFACIFIFIGIAILLGGTALCLMAWQPLRIFIAEYTVEREGLRGEAELRRAEQNRMILIEQARAEKEAASQRAEAIQIVGQAAKDFPEYRYQEFLGAFGEAFRDGTISQIVYVPTEGMIPITEAGRAVKQ